MNELYELKKLLMRELEEYGSKGKLDAGALDVVDKLAHSLKNLCKVIEDNEEYSGDYPMRSYRGRMSYRRDGRGRYSGDYSRHGDMVEELRALMQDAPDDRTRQEFQRFISKVEAM